MKAYKKTGQRVSTRWGTGVSVLEGRGEEGGMEGLRRSNLSHSGGVYVSSPRVFCLLADPGSCSSVEFRRFRDSATSSFTAICNVAESGLFFVVVEGTGVVAGAADWGILGLEEIAGLGVGTVAAAGRETGAGATGGRDLVWGGGTIRLGGDETVVAGE